MFLPVIAVGALFFFFLFSSFFVSMFCEKTNPKKKKKYKIYCKHDNCKQGFIEDNTRKLTLTEKQIKAHREFQSRLRNTFFIECKCN